MKKIKGNEYLNNKEIIKHGDGYLLLDNGGNVLINETTLKRDVIISAIELQNDEFSESFKRLNSFNITEIINRKFYIKEDEKINMTYVDYFARYTGSEKYNMEIDTIVYGKGTNIFVVKNKKLSKHEIKKLLGYEIGRECK